MPIRLRVNNIEPAVAGSKQALMNTYPEIVTFGKPCHPGECQDPGKSTGDWIIHFAYPSGRLAVVQRALRFGPAFAGITSDIVSGWVLT
jgi:hypothetical protein